MSIDGKRFVYSSHRGAADQFANLYVLPVEGGEPYKLTFFEHDAFHPRWSPDGEWIAYISNEGGLPQLALLETYGGDDRDVDIVAAPLEAADGRALGADVDDRPKRQTMASRIHLTAADGKFYAPDRRLRARGAGRREHIFHITGAFTLEVPVGQASHRGRARASSTGPRRPRSRSSRAR